MRRFIIDLLRGILKIDRLEIKLKLYLWMLKNINFIVRVNVWHILGRGLEQC